MTTKAGTIRGPALLILLGLWVAPGAWGVGGQFGVEFAIDAPWRLEPYGTAGRYRYDPIPIVVTFHDAVFDETRDRLGRLAVNRIRVGTLRRIEVVERLQGGPVPGRNGSVTVVRPDQLRDIQRKARISTRDFEPGLEVCEPVVGTDCSAFLEISHTHEWHAAFWYRPRLGRQPGRNVQLEVTVVTVRDGDERRFRNDLVVHLGEAPLPRFSSRWLYGDLHYHSQMTDNEGESGYSYRNALRGMAAIGLDYLFATDHASNSVQFDGRFAVKSCGGLAHLSCRPIQRPGGSPARCSNGEPVMICKGVEARDLNPSRFATAWREAWSANLVLGGEVERGLLRSVSDRRILPQLYVGEELDAWPQMSVADYRRGTIAYGDGLEYHWTDSGGCREERSLAECRKRYAYQERPGEAVRVLDDQGASFSKIADGFGVSLPFDDSEQFPSRQHLVYMPTGMGRGKGFIGSDTGVWGGASKTLRELLPVIERGGSAFLAHPLASSRPGSDFGPDIVPYSTDSLDLAWRSRGILGLQLWNEDDRFVSTLDRVQVKRVMRADNSGEKSFTYTLPWRDGTLLSSTPKKWQKRVPVGSRERRLRQGTFVWDAYLRRGLDQSRIAKLDWLPDGYPRRWFMAGGSDAHGDLNFRRHGRPLHSAVDGRCVDFWCDFPVSDTALGKPRNLTLMSRPTGQRRAGDVSHDVHSNLNAISALQRGAFTVTDGPALRIVLDRDRDELVGDDDFQMGSVARIFAGEHIPVLVEWMSTPEFGPVERVDVYLGTRANTFAPPGHGPGRGSQGRSGYAGDPSRGNLRFDVPEAQGMHGMAVIYLAPAQFHIGADNHLFYLRAFAQTGADGCPPELEGGNSCGKRFAFTNPVWGDFQAICRKSGRGIDADGNGMPDTCERELDDPCLSPAQEVTSRRPGTVSSGQRAGATGGSGSSGAGGSAGLGGAGVRRLLDRVPAVTPEAQLEVATINEPRFQSCSDVRPVSDRMDVREPMAVPDDGRLQWRRR